MRLFKSKQERKDERQAEFIAFLQSVAGRKTISEIALDVVNSNFTPIVNEVQGQLLKAAKDQLINLQIQLQALTASRTARFTADVEETLKSTKAQFINFLRSDEAEMSKAGQSILRGARQAFDYVRGERDGLIAHGFNPPVWMVSASCLTAATHAYAAGLPPCTCLCSNCCALTPPISDPVPSWADKLRSRTRPPNGRYAIERK